MHPFPSPYNTGPRACEGLGETPESRFSTFVVVSALLHLAVMCTLFHWHGQATNPLIAGNGMIEIKLVSIPAMKEATSTPDEPEAMRGETPVPWALHSPAAEKLVIPAVPATEEPPPPVEKQADTPASVQEELIAPIDAAGTTASPAPVAGISDKGARQEAVPGVTALNSSSESPPDGPGANEPVATDTTGSFTPGEPGSTSPGASPGQRYVEKNFYYIKDLITRNLTYPVVARRMKWQGTVVVSFVVFEDGTVESIKVVTSSGHGVLDKNVVAAIEQVQPFPAPPAAAEFTMPIKYTLRP